MNYAVELSPQQSSRILECVTRAQSAVGVLPKSWSSGQLIRGRVLDGDEETLTIEAPVTPRQATLLNTYCQVDLALEDGQYFFDSHVLAVQQIGEHLRLTLARPHSILVIQRRRSQRLHLAGSSAVQLSGWRGQELWTCQGQLYNLSHEGLALKIVAEDAVVLRSGQPCCACFEVPEQGHTYKLQGALCHILPAAQPGEVILGIQFNASEEDQDQIRMLRSFLRDRQQTGAVPGETP